jgi:hypothetical protein
MNGEKRCNIHREQTSEAIFGELFVALHFPQHLAFPFDEWIHPGRLIGKNYERVYLP